MLLSPLLYLVKYLLYPPIPQGQSPWWRRSLVNGIGTSGPRLTTGSCNARSYQFSCLCSWGRDFGIIRMQAFSCILVQNVKCLIDFCVHPWLVSPGKGIRDLLSWCVVCAFERSECSSSHFRKISVIVLLPVVYYTFWFPYIFVHFNVGIKFVRSVCCDVEKKRVGCVMTHDSSSHSSKNSWAWTVMRTAEVFCRKCVET